MMKQTGVLSYIQKQKSKGLKSLAVLIDPDFADINHLDTIIKLADKHKIDFFFVGGSLLTKPNALSGTIDYLNKKSNIPKVLFPGNHQHIHPKADAILLLSLISGRNPDFLIGNHVLAAPMLKASKLEIIPTAYMLIDGGSPTTASYISGTNPMPRNKPSIAACTAMAGEMLGLKAFFLDAGSGAKLSVPNAIIKSLATEIQSPIIVGGGISSAEEVQSKWDHGADLVVIGNKIEQEPDFINSLGKLKK